MRVEFKCTRIIEYKGHTYTGEHKTEINEETGRISKHPVVGDACSCFTVCFDQVGGGGKLELDRIPSAAGFTEGKTYTFDIGG